MMGHKNSLIYKEYMHSEYPERLRAIEEIYLLGVDFNKPIVRDTRRRITRNKDVMDCFSGYSTSREKYKNIFILRPQSS